MDVRHIALMVCNCWESRQVLRLIVDGVVIVVEPDGSGLGIELPVGTDLSSFPDLQKRQGGDGDINVMMQTENDSFAEYLFINGNVRIDGNDHVSQWIMVDANKVSAAIPN